MNAIVDHLISEPGTYFYVNHRGKLAAHTPAILEALTPRDHQPRYVPRYSMCSTNRRTAS